MSTQTNLSFSYHVAKEIIKQAIAGAPSGASKKTPSAVRRKLMNELQPGDIIISGFPSAEKQMQHDADSPLFERSVEKVRKWLLGNKSSHASIYIGDGYTIDDLPGHGVSYGKVEYYAERGLDHFRVLRPEGSKSYKKKLIADLEKRVEKEPYSKKNFVGSLLEEFGLPAGKISEKDKFHCSGLVGNQYCDIMDQKKNPHLVTPADFDKQPRIKPVMSFDKIDEYRWGVQNNPAPVTGTFRDRVKARVSGVLANKPVKAVGALGLGAGALYGGYKAYQHLTQPKPAAATPKALQKQPAPVAAPKALPKTPVTPVRTSTRDVRSDKGKKRMPYKAGLG